MIVFLIGLVGIVATGVIMGMGGDNYWSLATVNPPFGHQHPPYVYGVALGAVTLVMIGLFDLIALAVMFAGGVVVVQRLRGRI